MEMLTKVGMLKKPADHANRYGWTPDDVRDLMDLCGFQVEYAHAPDWVEQAEQTLFHGENTMEMPTNEQQDALERMEGGFMKPQIIGPAAYVEIETEEGTFYCPAEDFDLRDWPNADSAHVHRDGYLARLSAPGYTDCTEWVAFGTVGEAADYLVGTYATENLDDPD